jgi:hypothetical protein
MATETERIILDIQIDDTGNEEQITKNTKLINDLEDANKDLREEIKKGGEAREKASKQLAINQNELKDLRKERNQNIKVQKTAAKSSDTLKKALEGEAKTLNELKDRNKELIKIRDNLDTTNKKGQKEFAKLNKVIKENNEQISEAEQGGGNFARGVGKYTDAIKGSIVSMLKNFAVITIVIKAIKGLVKLFKRSEEGAGKFADGMAKLRGAVGAVVGRVGKLAKGLVDVVKGEKKLKDLKGTFDGLGDSINEAANAAAKISKLERSIAKLNDTTIVAVANLNQINELQAAIADDATLSFQERIKADEEARKSSEALAKRQLELAQQEFELLDLKVKQDQRIGKFDQEQITQRAQAQAALIDAETALTKVVFDNAKRRREINQDNFEQELDFLIDVADNQKTVNERLLKDTTISFIERQRILEETDKVLSDSFEQQIALFEETNNIQIETNKLLQLNNEESFEYARSLQLSEIETNRLLEVIRERRLAVQDLRDAELDLANELQKSLDDLTKQGEEFLDTIDADIDKFISSEEAASQKFKDDWTESFEKTKEKAAETFQTITDLSAQLGAGIAEAVASGEDEIKGSLKVILNTLLDFLTAQIPVIVAQITGLSLAQPDSILTFGASGIARAGIITGLLTGAVQLAKSAVNKFEYGGDALPFGGKMIGGKPHSMGGTKIFTDTGQVLGEAQKDEGAFIMKKDATAALLSAHNESFGGRSFFGKRTSFAQEGGQLGGSLSSEDIGREVRAALEGLTIVTTVEDITTGISEREKVLKNSVIE